MDVVTDALIQDVLSRRLRGTTVILIAHRPSSLSRCDGRVEVSGGRARRVPNPQ
jgi:ABC-type multidrug transport system fused ATPase/permease subunit